MPPESDPLTPTEPHVQPPVAPHTATAPEAILSHTAWIHRLARHLARDPDLADDLAQATYVAALERPPATTQNVRGWLATVTRNVWRQTARSERRRVARERELSSEAPTPPTDETVAKAQTHRLVVDEVLALAEPFRTAVLLRFFEDLPPRVIAKRTGVPVATVHSRIGRGIRLLRGRLETRCGGDRAALATMLVPLMAQRGLGPALATGAILMNSKAILIPVALILAGAGLFWKLGSGDTPAPTGATVAATPTDNAANPPPAPTPDPGRHVVPVAPAAQPDTPAIEASAATFHGRALDLDGRAVPAATVKLVGTSAVATTDSVGGFELPVPDRPREIVVADPDLTTVLVGSATPEMQSGSDPVVIIARRLDVSGTVTDAHGAPVADVRVECTLPDGFRARIDAALDRTRVARWIAHTGANGAYSFAELGQVTGAELHFTREGYLPASLPQPTTDTRDANVTLATPAAVEGALLGQVLAATGAPVRGAKVSLGNAAAVSGDDGRFVLPLAEAGVARRLVAFERGHLPGHVELAEFEQRPNPPPFVFVRLGAAPHAISGRVVDPRGAPVAGFKVWVADPEVATIDDSAVAVEAYLGGGLTRAEMLARFARDGRPTKPVEQILDETPTARWGWAMTGDDGRFTLGGLLDRPYTLEGMHTDTLVRTSGGPFEPGVSNATLVVPDGVLAPRVAGRVVALSGTPLAGVKVMTSSDGPILHRTVRYPDGRQSRSSSGRSETGQATVTDADGRFEFENLGTVGVRLSFTGDGVLPRRLTLDDPARRGPIDDFVVQVDARVHFRIELTDATFADKFKLLDAAGETQRVHVIQADGQDVYTSMSIHDGRTGVLSASERVATVVFSKAGTEVKRVSVAFVPDTVNVVTP